MNKQNKGDMKMIYREEKEQSKKYKEEYVLGIERIIETRQKKAELIREDYIKDIFENQDKYRNDFKEMLGWPLVDYEPDGLPEVEMEKLSDEDG